MFNLILRALPPGLYFLILLYSPDDYNLDLFASILLTINLVKFSELGLRLTLEQRKKFEFNIKDIFYSITSSLIIYSFCYFFFIAKLNFNFFEVLILYFTCIMLTFAAITGAYFNIIDKLNRFYLILIFYPLYNFITLYLYGSEILIEYNYLINLLFILSSILYLKFNNLKIKINNKSNLINLTALFTTIQLSENFIRIFFGIFNINLLAEITLITRFRAVVIEIYAETIRGILVGRKVLIKKFYQNIIILNSIIFLLIYWHYYIDASNVSYFFIFLFLFDIFIFIKVLEKIFYYIYKFKDNFWKIEFIGLLIKILSVSILTFFDNNEIVIVLSTNLLASIYFYVRLNKYKFFNV